MACPDSFAIAKADHLSEYAEAGQDLHEEISAQIESGHITREYVREALEGLSFIQTETAYVLNFATRTCLFVGRNVGGTKLDQALGRPRTQDEMAVILDVEGYLPDETHVVIDWKSRERVTHPRRNWQMRMQALTQLTSSRRDALKVETRIVYLDDGEAETYTYTQADVGWLWKDVADCQSRLERRRLAILNGAALEVTSGKHCKYCPALSHCPSMRGMIKHFVSELEGIAPFMTEDAIMEIPESVLAKAIDVWGKTKALGDRFEKLYRLRAEREPIKMNDGRVLKVIECKGRSSFDAETAVMRLQLAGQPTDDLTKRGKPYTRLQMTEPKEEK